MARWQLTATLLALLLAITSSVSLAAGTTATVKVSWKVLPFQSLAIAGDDSSGTSVSSHFDLRQPTDADFAGGYIEEPRALTLVAASNIPWTVRVHALEPNIGTSDDGTYVKPLPDFSLRANGGAYFAVTRFDQTLANGDVGKHTLVIDYKVLTGREPYKDGDYGLTLVYTITSN